MGIQHREIGVEEGENTAVSHRRIARGDNTVHISEIKGCYLTQESISLHWRLKGVLLSLKRLPLSFDSYQSLVIESTGSQWNIRSVRFNFWFFFILSR